MVCVHNADCTCAKGSTPVLDSQPVMAFAGDRIDVTMNFQDHPCLGERSEGLEDEITLMQTAAIPTARGPWLYGYPLLAQYEHGREQRGFWQTSMREVGILWAIRSEYTQYSHCQVT